MAETLINPNQILGGGGLTDTLYLAKVGTLTINDGAVSGFSSSNYLKMINFDPSKSFEFKLKIKANQIRSLNSCVIGYKSSGGVIGISFGGDGYNTIKLMLSTDTSSWNIADTRGTTELSANVDYYIKFYFGNSNYILSLSTDDVTYTTECVVASSSLIFNGTKFDLAFGAGHPNADWHFDGTIYLNSSYFQQDGVRYNLAVAQ